MNKLILTEASLPTEQEFTSTDIYDLVQRNDYEGALQKAITGAPEDINKVVSYYIVNNLKNLSYLVDDESSMNLIGNWVSAFKTLNKNNNPFINYLEYLNRVNIKPTYNELAIINNKYSNNVLTNKSLMDGTRASVLEDSEFYDDNERKQDYVIDVWAYLTDDYESRRLVSEYQDVENQDGTPRLITFSGDSVGHQFVDSSKPSYRELVNLVLYYDGAKPTPNKINKLMRTEQEIRKNVSLLSRNIKKDNKEEIQDKDKLDNLLSKISGDKELLKDLKTYLNQIKDL